MRPSVRAALAAGFFLGLGLQFALAQPRPPDGKFYNLTTLNTFSASRANVTFLDAGVAKISEIDFTTGGAVNCKTIGGTGLICAGTQLAISGGPLLAQGGSGYVKADAYLWGVGNGGYYVGSGATVLLENFDGGTLTGGGSRCEYGSHTLSGSAATAVFKTAFGVAPVCTCSHVAAVPLSCGPTAHASTTQVPFAVPTGSGIIEWVCCGGV